MLNYKMNETEDIKFAMPTESFCILSSAIGKTHFLANMSKIKKYIQL